MENHHHTCPGTGLNAPAPGRGRAPRPPVALCRTRRGPGASRTLSAHCSPTGGCLWCPQVHRDTRVCPSPATRSRCHGREIGPPPGPRATPGAPAAPGPIRKATPMTTPRPVIFIHGLWLHATSWTPWVELFREAGYDPSAPGWPGDPDTVEEARANPDSIADHGIDDVVAHYAEIIGGLDRQADPGRTLLRRHDRPEAARARTWPPPPSPSTPRRSRACCRCRCPRCGPPCRCSRTRPTSTGPCP